jgi:hypothetical protein
VVSTTDIWPVVPALVMNDDECGAIGGMIRRRNRRKPALVPFCPPQIPLDLTWARTGAALGTWRLTT